MTRPEGSSGGESPAAQDTMAELPLKMIQQVKYIKELLEDQKRFQGNEIVASEPCLDSRQVPTIKTATTMENPVSIMVTLPQTRDQELPRLEIILRPAKSWFGLTINRLAGGLFRSLMRVAVGVHVPR